MNLQILLYADNKCLGPVKCGEHKFCVGFEDFFGLSKVYCYGSTKGCKWNENDCRKDSDCAKYNRPGVPKYTDGDEVQCPNQSGWRADACKCNTGSSSYELSPFSKNIWNFYL